MAAPKIIADFESQLSTAIAAAGTAFSLSSAIDDDGVSLPSGTYYFTVDNASSGKEYLKGTLSGSDVTSVYSVSRQGVETSGAARAHRVGASVLITDFATYKAYMDALAIAGAPDASSSTKGIVEVAIASEIDSNSATGATGAPIAITPDQLILSKYGFAVTAVVNMAGLIAPFAGRSAPTGWLLCDGTAVSRTTYASLFAVIAPSGTFTVTIATPGLFSKTAHGLVEGDKVHFTTTGALPTGLAINTDYYVIAAGLTTDAFEVAATPGGAAINTTGSQSGVHTLYASAFGKGDGSTTFNLPDMRSRMPLGKAATAPTTTLTFAPAAVDTANDWITILDTVFPSQGQKVQLTSTGTLPAGLSLATDYYVVRLTATTLGFFGTQAGANAGSLVNITDQGTGIHTMTFTNRTHPVLGRMGGEESHSVSDIEMASHAHNVATTGSTGSGIHGFSTAGYITNGNSGPTQITDVISTTGSDGLHNNMSPFMILNYIIKI